MPVDVVNEIVIARSRALVAAFSANPDNAPKCLMNIKSVEHAKRKWPSLFYGSCADLPHQKQ
jgi:hypothetical protein